MFKKQAIVSTAAFAWALLLMIVSVMPGQDLPSVKLWEADKIFHALFYGILTVLVFFAFRHRMSNPILISAVLCILYGFLIELIQLWLPGRTFDIFDELANAIGSILAVAGLAIIRPKPPRA